VTAPLKFGRLEFVSKGVPTSRNQARWVMRCDCGATVTKLAYAVKRGTTASCGCLSREMTSARSSTHGEARPGRRTREYAIWVGIKTRRSRGYAGGVTMDARWDASFEAFLADMGRAPSRSHSIDRIDNGRGYEPSNCRWATPTEQNRNKRNNTLITIAGETKCMAEWCRQFGIKVPTAAHRLRRGWSHERAVSESVNGATCR